MLTFYINNKDIKASLISGILMLIAKQLILAIKVLTFLCYTALAYFFLFIN